MHGRVSNHNKRSRKDGQSDNIAPKGAVVEPESAENGGARDFDVEAVFVINQCKVFDLIDNQAFEPVMKY